MDGLKTVIERAVASAEEYSNIREAMALITVIARVWN
jgi:hypothetical protein